jgi:hypothetical protein
VIGFQLTQGFLAGPGVGEVVFAECEAGDAPAFFFDLPSFAGDGDAGAAGAVRVDPNAVFRVWAFAGEGEGVAAALRARCGASEGDAVFVAVGLFAAAACSWAPSSVGRGDSEGVGV